MERSGPQMATPKWTYNRLMRNIDAIEQVMVTMDKESKNYKDLSRVVQSLTGLAVVVRKDQK